MSESLMVQGRSVGELDLEWLRQWMGQNPGWSRRRLSQALATHWNWRNGAGQLLAPRSARRHPLSPARNPRPAPQRRRPQTFQPPPT
jgi:hypothetical protein